MYSHNGQDTKLPRCQHKKGNQIEELRYICKKKIRFPGLTKEH